MRFLAVLSLWTAAFAQTVGFGRYSGPTLPEYLKLTPEQAATLDKNAKDYEASQSGLLDRINIVNDQIGIETSKSAPDGMLLGMRYREVELICREAKAPRQSAYDRQMAVLDETQRDLVRKLQEQRTLQLIAATAYALFFLPAPEPETDPRLARFYNQPYQGIQLPYELQSTGAAFDVTPELAAHLKLSTSQLDAIRKALQAHATYFQGETSKMRELGKQIESDFARAELSAGDLGGRYIQIENIRRGIGSRETSLRREIDSLLTAEQRAVVSQLEPNPNYLLIYNAESLLLFPPHRAASSPASRVSALDLTVTDGFSTVSGASFLPENSTAEASIYRACQAGPNYSPVVDLRQ
jgi:hypothetical protein